MNQRPKQQLQQQGDVNDGRRDYGWKKRSMCSPANSSVMSHMLRLTVMSTLMLGLTSGQQITCFDGSTGYGTLAGLNNDIQTQVEDIENGGTPQDIYLYRFCPDTQIVFGENDQLSILLSGSVFRCGDNGDSSDLCTFTGGTNQVVTGPSIVPGYEVTNAAFEGITFTDFSNSALSGTATSAMTVTFEDTVFAVRIKIRHPGSPLQCTRLRSY